ncbi:hypothetical protein [Mammaliicoccus sciuri]|uniref:hypothetical protein n=1 Tax=Mammaliicoccus sciuri TaxID=1296 RepID=UPI0034DD38BC
MANEILGTKTRVILVQIDQEGVERALYQDSWNGSFIQTENISSATTFESIEKGQQVADALNNLYQITNKKFNTVVVKEVIERTTNSTSESE